MDGLELTRIIYTRLRRPADTDLSYTTILNIVLGVIRKLKLDLSLSEQNTLSTVSEWFTPFDRDLQLNSISGELAHVLFPIRVETRSTGSEAEIGREVPIVDHSVLYEHPGCVAFYGTPIRIAFRDETAYLSEREYRVVFENDFTDNLNLERKIHLPDFFMEMVVEESLYKLAPLVEDSSQEWELFMTRLMPQLQISIADWRASWKIFVANSHGKKKVFKRSFLNNRSRGPRFRPRGHFDV